MASLWTKGTISFQFFFLPPQPPHPCFFFFLFSLFLIASIQFIADKNLNAAPAALHAFTRKFNFYACARASQDERPLE